MAFHFARHVTSRHAAALAGAGFFLNMNDSNSKSDTASCEAAPPVVKDEEQHLYHGLFPKRQLFNPSRPYPLWDANWDKRQPTPLEDKDLERRRNRLIRKTGVTRHVILIRHGQYNEAHKEDEKRTLTELGREQADLTGKRIAEMIQGELEADCEEEEEAEGDDGKKSKFSGCHVKIIRVSDMVRAKETANIIAKHLPGVERAKPDELLNEGRPAHNIPGGKASEDTIARTDEQGVRIEQAFQKYFYRSGETPGSNDGAASESPEPRHEFEIIVCHANVIRYFLMRSLQLPPEAWLRFCNLNCSLTYLTIRPTGTVSCRMFGDIGHLPYTKSTFSGHAGYNW